MLLIVPTDAPAVLDPVDGVEMLPYDPEQNLTEAHLAADAAVLWGFASPIIDQLVGAPNLRWIQTLTAGPDPVLAAGFPDSVQVTTGRGFHDETVAEHTIALTLAGLRQLPEAAAAQREHRWAAELSGFKPLHDGKTLTTLIDSRVTIWGFGSIGQACAARFAAFGASVTGVARSAGERGGFPVVATEQVDELLPRTDVLVLVLPKSPATDNVLDARRLALLPAWAWVVNVGRGNAIDEEALVAALTAGTLGGAALDVMQTEPLPSDSPLWSAPRTILTPHNAGGRPLHTREFIGENLRRFVAGEPLRNLATR
ncbi:NAD(P)-dependent oxidoreductase [Micropruina sp.]|uniref:NAD(P)-dependent oxidoreductase n=1 Tax=Micropruina sp. TaxID=2737536 RepID=UPI0039E727AA